MQQEGTVTLFQYWNRLRDGRPAPLRSEIEPADIKTLLADTFILEADSRGEAVFRLAGTRLCAVYGRELKGFSFPSLWRTHDYRAMTRLLNGVFRDATVAVITYAGITARESRATFEMMILPLDLGHESKRSLGVVTACDHPYWLGADPVVDAEITGIQVIDPDQTPLMLKNRPPIEVPPPLSAENVPSLRPLQTPRRVRHLLVLEGGLKNSSNR